MSDTNEKTIAAYNTHVLSYVANTPHEISRTVKTWLDVSLEGLPIDARILEIGSGFGHDAAYIEQQGYTVERTDVTPGFVELLRSQGYEARRLNILVDEIGGTYDLIFANAVLHHLTQPETRLVAENVLGSLGVGGRFAIGFRLGLTEGWSNEKMGVPRYFTRWCRGDVEGILEQVGFIGILATDGNKPNASWLHLVCHKGEE